MSIAGKHFRVHLASDSENDWRQCYAWRYASMSMADVINALIGNVDCVG